MANTANPKDIDMSKLPNSILIRLTSLVELLQRFKTDQIEIDSDVHKDFVANASTRTVAVIKEYSLLPDVLKDEGSEQTALVNDSLDKADKLLKEIYRDGLAKQTASFDSAVTSFEEFLSLTITEED